MSDPGWSNAWWGRDPIEQAGEDPAEFDPVRAREDDKEAFERLKQYIEEHRGELLGLELALSLYRRPQ
jgi:hypothetical protein